MIIIIIIVLTIMMIVMMMMKDIDASAWHLVADCDCCDLVMATMESPKVSTEKWELWFKFEKRKYLLQGEERGHWMLSPTLSNILLKVKRTRVSSSHLLARTASSVCQNCRPYFLPIFCTAFTPHIFNRHTYATVFTNPRIYVHQNRLKLTELELW